MITLTSAEMNAWIATLIWPLCRILGLIATVPVFGHAAVPITSKIGLGVMLTLIIAPTLGPLPAVEPMSPVGILILTQETLIGLALGFSMRLVFAAVELAGEISSLTMGLGFASFYDPSSQGRSSAVSQFFALLATLAFVAVNGHLLVISALAESFVSMPISATPINAGGFLQLAHWGNTVFSAGVQLSLPIVAALLLTNLALGILTRAAPSLNLFGIGFPITLAIGFVVISVSLPYLATPWQNLFQRGIENTRSLGRTWNTRAAPVPAPPVARPAAAPSP